MNVSFVNFFLPPLESILQHINSIESNLILLKDRIRIRQNHERMSLRNGGEQR